MREIVTPIPRMREVAQALADIPHEGPDADFDIMKVEAVLDRLGVTREEFRDLDEKPGYVGYRLPDGREWHWRLRRYRNQPPFQAWWRRTN